MIALPGDPMLPPGCTDAQCEGGNQFSASEHYGTGYDPVAAYDRWRDEQLYRDLEFNAREWEKTNKRTP